MKMIKNKLIICLLVLLCAFFSTCENEIMRTWWPEKAPDVVTSPTYYIITEHEEVEVYIYLTEYIIEYLTQIEYIELPPIIIYEIVYETITEVVTQVIVKHHTRYVDVIKEIITEIIVPVPTDPTEEQIIEYIKDPNNRKKIIEVIVNNTEIKEELIEVLVKEYLTKEKLIEIINNIPPEEIIEYLTITQKEEIFKLIPPTKIIQTIKIINIEFILFSGDQVLYNQPAVPPAVSNLTTEEQATNTKNVQAMAKVLHDNPEYMMILHGHANPVTGTAQEKQELKEISEGRAGNVDSVLRTEYQKLAGAISDEDWREKVKVTGYDGERNLSSTSYAGLNRRVEMILFTIDTITEKP